MGTQEDLEPFRKPLDVHPHIVMDLDIFGAQ